MDDFVKVATVAEIPVGRMKTVMVGGKRVAVANVDGEFFAIDDVCSHEECSLGSEGYLDGNVVICGCHGSNFDVTTGKVLSLPAPTDVTSYQTKVENGNIFVKL
ncbi:MAG: hypothetical protein ACD_48C00471G0002 [uncultured bacterium]|uniref:Rieske domain-containing protein n=1 Tax=Candidatus Gottesmanbacteria bacterium RIFCSPLOWO2_01_FULL_43_11b TaxID=1798392 RepID=A0A1F6AJA7_9BACT|nr:MAG: hypothetical protein ACD_48C00471G0002 [uncultured bacterium]OGG24357.1 MAG: hypothetical protein A3A79_04195 [Candidatus Gottesmanbacteria bacterium RIFCSPLOWO2_01_FULL_43_11b]